MKLSRILASVALTAISFTTLAGPADRQHLDLRAMEVALKAQPTGTPTSTRGGSANYTGTLVGALTWDRPFADCTGQSSLGPVGYSVQPFTVDTTGSFDVASVQTGWDGYIFIYEVAFDPNNGNTNCVIGNDDGGGGIGTSDILGETLTAGTQYLLVTTAFEAGEEGPFDNTITGPGTITLGGLGPQADLGVTVTAPDGVLTGGNFTYDLVATNAGPDNATNVIVTNVLSPDVTFVSSSCGATEAAGTVTWTIGAFANGGNATCTITVTGSATCSVVDNVASIDGTEADPAGANNSALFSNSAGNLVLDPSFEDGTPSIEWTEASTNFGTPLCDVACGVGNGTGPRTGDFWAWFGGFPTGAETGSLSQAMVIPAGATSLSFFVEFPVCNNGTSDFVRFTIDGTELWREDSTSARCNTVGYQQVVVDVSAFDDDLSHTIGFNSATIGAGNASNFFIDDLELLAAPVCGTAVVQTLPDVPVPAIDRFGVAFLMMLLGLMGVVASRRHTA